MSKKTYKVTGPVAYAGNKPGETFDADLPEDVERRAVDRGSIKVVTNKKETKADG